MFGFVEERISDPGIVLVVSQQVVIIVFVIEYVVILVVVHLLGMLLGAGTTAGRLARCWRQVRVGCALVVRIAVVLAVGRNVLAVAWLRHVQAAFREQLVVIGIDSKCPTCLQNSELV